MNENLETPLVSGQACGVAPKWVAIIDDAVVPMPRQKVAVAVLRTQSTTADNLVLVRDFNSPNDVVLPDDGQVDLGEGNVFYTLARCDVVPRSDCHETAKLAFVMDDKFEVVIRADQSGKSLRELFGLAQHAQVFRDYEGPNDKNIEGSATVQFQDGPVFYSRHAVSKLSITVNMRKYGEQDGVRAEMKGIEIAALAFPEKPEDTCVRLVSEGNREIPLNEVLHIRGCEEFEVVRKQVTGGFEMSRVNREIELLRASGQLVTVIEEPVKAVVYHKLRVRPGAPVPIENTDVLVPIPGAYPGQMIDWGYLPLGSPLIGKVQGAAQEHRITALGQVWQQVSYHPHNGGGAPAWNPTTHGFHTYIGELLSWLSNL